MMDIDTVKFLRGLVAAGDNAGALRILDAEIDGGGDDNDDDDDDALKEDGHPSCECGRPRHLCTTFNNQSEEHGDA